ncbi:putative ribonuclease H-like domain-containing protein [Tanacetum coccineum]
MTTAGIRAVVNTGKGKMDTDLKKSRWVWRPKGNYLDHVSKDSGSFMLKKGNPEILLQDHAVVDSGCSSHMTGNKAYLSNNEDFNGGFVTFGSDPKGDELKFNLFSVSQMCDKKNSVLFTESECLILSPSFKLLDESQVVLRAPRKDDVYNLDLKNIVPSGGQRIPVDDIAPAIHEKPSESSPKDNDVQASEDVADKEEQHQMKESEKDLQDELEKMVTQELAAKAMDDVSRQALEEEKRRIASQKKATQATSTNILSTDRPSVSTYRPFVSTDRPYVNIASTPTGTNANASVTSPKIMEIFNGDYDDDEDVGAVADFNNMDNTIAVSPIPTLRIHKDHPKGQILGDLTSAVQTRGKIQKASSTQQALFKLQKVWVLVDLPYGKKVINTKWVFRNKRDERSIVVKNKARLIAQGFRQEEGIDYNEVFAPVATIEEIRTATTPIESNKSLVKDDDGVDVDVHVYRSMIGFLMYLTASRPDIMFAVCACARFQVTPKASHLNAVKRIFRYLKHQPKLGLWYPRDSPFELEAYSDSDYGGASLDRKSTTGGCQFLGRRLISWQCKKQTIVANSTTEAEYVAAANCCGQVLWIQNQMMDYGFNFMNTKIHIDNESTISVIKNPVAHSRTKHIEIRFHFIRDCYEKRLIEVIKIHTDHNVADLLTKGFDVTRISMDLRMDRSCAANSTHIWSYSDKHNMVALLKKPNESVGFTKVVDFLKGTSLSPKSRGWDQFGSTVATALIYLSSGLATLGYVTEGAAMDQGEGSAQPAEPHPTPVDPLPSTSLPPIPSPPPQSPPHQSPPHSPHQSPPHSPHQSPPHSPHQSPPHSPHQSPPHSPLQSPPYSPPHSSPPRSYEAPLPEGNTSGSAEDSVQLKELMVLVPNLVNRVTSLEKELKETKQTLGNVVLKLVKRVKSLETDLKRKSKKLIVSESESEELEDQGEDNSGY